jgi:hypothetical protein
VITLRGTDPNDWEVVGNTIIDANGSASDVMLFNSGEDANFVLAGLTIRNGYNRVYCSETSPTIMNCIIEDNS